MQKSIRMITTLAITSCGMLTMAPSPGFARTTASHDVLTVRDVLRLNPAAKPFGPNEVEISNGVVLTVPQRAATASGGAALAPSCVTYYVCVYEHQFTHIGTNYSLRFYKCGVFTNLGALRYPDGAYVGTGAAGPKWNDRISSMINSQTPGTRANFYNWERLSTGREGWKLVFWTWAPDRRANLAIDKRMDNGGRINDIIDALQPC